MVISLDEFKKQFEKEVLNVHNLGVKGKKPHVMIRYLLGYMHIKKLNKQRSHVLGDYKKVKESILKHDIVKSEATIKDAIELVMEGTRNIYDIIYTLSIFEMDNIHTLHHLANDFKGFCHKHGLDHSDEAKRFHKLIGTMVDLWEKSLKDIRQDINNIYRHTRGEHGGKISQAIFEGMHNAGYLFNLKTRRVFKDEHSTESKIKNMINELHHLKKRDALKPFFERLQQSEEHIINDFAVIFDMLFMVWDKLIGDLNNLCTLVAKAAHEQHELPAKDSDAMTEIRYYVIQVLGEKFLKNIQMMDVQIEKEVEQLRHAA